MGDHVSREWLLRHLFFETDRELVRRAPDAEPVRSGTWVSAGDDYSIRVLTCVCKDCGSHGAEWMRYCPGCGREMDGGADNER